MTMLKRFDLNYHLKIFILILTAFILKSHTYGQVCDCSNVVKEIIRSVEKNYVGFKIKTSGLESKHKSFVQKILSASERNKNIEQCYRLVREYLAFFKDPHLAINFVVNKSTIPEIQKAFSQKERSPLWEKHVSNGFNFNNKDSIEGVWTNEDSSYVVAILRNNKKKYYAFVKKADSTFWFPGQIKFEFDLKSSELSYYRRAHDLEKTKFIIHRNLLYITRYGYWKKVGTNGLTGFNTIDSFSRFYYKQLTDSTGLLRLPDFALSSTKQVDSLIENNLNRLSSLPNLIIDIRDNPGGFSSAFNSLLPFVYGTSYTNYSYALLASDDNIDLYKKFAKNNNIKPGDGFYELISMLEQNKDTFYLASSKHTYFVDSVYSNPKKIVLLLNKGTVSAAEDLALKAKQSEKVTLLGENSKGVLDYQNIIMARPVISCIYYSFNCPTGMSIDGPKIDGTGVTPTIKLTSKEDWILSAVKYLEKIIK